MLCGTQTTIQVDTTATILEVKERFASCLGIGASRQRLTHGCEELKNELSLADYGLTDGSHVTITIELVWVAKLDPTVLRVDGSEFGRFTEDVAREGFDVPTLFLIT